MAKILVIDDNLENREILTARLEQAGHQVIEAKDGEDGLQMCRSQKPDLVFLDVMMPKIDGLHVCRQLKEDPVTLSIPIVLLTALGQKIDQLRGYESGADDYLAKPWDPPDLLGILKKYIPISRDEDSVTGIQK